MNDRLNKQLTQLNTMVLLDKQYTSESLSNLGRDVDESLEFPYDRRYLHIKPDKHGFTQGTYKVTITYTPTAEELEG